MTWAMGKLSEKCENLNVSNLSCYHLFMSLYPYPLSVYHLPTYTYSYKKKNIKMWLRERHCKKTVIICSRENAVMTNWRKTCTTNFEIEYGSTIRFRNLYGTKSGDKTLAKKKCRTICKKKSYDHWRCHTHSCMSQSQKSFGMFSQLPSRFASLIALHSNARFKT